MVYGPFNSVLEMIMIVSKPMRWCAGHTAGVALALLAVAACAAGAAAQTSPSPPPPAATTAPVVEPPPPAATTAPVVEPAPPAATTAPPAEPPPTVSTTPPAADAQSAPMPGAPSAPAAAPAPGGVTQEIVDNPYGLSALWNSGDWVARGTLIALVIMSMGTWYIMITKLIEQTQLLRQARAASRKFWTAPSIPAGAALLSKRSAFRQVVEDGLRATEHHEGTLTEEIDLNSWITMSLQRSVDTINNRMQGGLAFLATVGSTAPFVGLFGTVWGIYHALTAIGIAGQASIDKVAGPVGEALIMTAMGLAVAVPAVLGYNWMVRRNKLAMDRVRSFAADLHALLIGGTRGAEKPMVRRA
jgi:biopolymer transport protein ExbB